MKLKIDRSKVILRNSKRGAKMFLGAKFLLVVLQPHSKSLTKQMVANTNTQLSFNLVYMKLKSDRRTGSVQNKVLFQV